MGRASMRGVALAGCVIGTLGIACDKGGQASAKELSVIAQSRDDQGRRVRQPVKIDPSKTAVVVIDMWDRHWCTTFTARVANLVPRMNLALDAARKLGIQVVFAPSDVVDFYKDDPRRKAMQAIAVHPEPKTVGFEAPPPPGPTDCCECGPDQPCREKRKVWSRQIADLKIADGDLIADCNQGRELLNLCAERGINTLLYMGVASNMCVQYRSMGIRNMKNHGLRVMVVSDLVEAIASNGLDAEGKVNLNYTPAGGTARVQKHLEQYLGATIESRQLLGAAGLGNEDKRPHLVVVTAEKEYESHRTLAAFARKYLENDFRCTLLSATADEGAGSDSIPGLQALYDADLLLMSIRRRALPVVQMDHLERFVRAGKPLVALRVSAAAFQVKPVPAGHVVWDRFDREVLGCNYAGYNAESRESGCEVWRVKEAADHPVLRGVSLDRWHSPSWLYRQRPLSPGAQVLMMGRWSITDEDEPVVWTNTYEDGRVFYTTLGHPKDFDTESFNQLLLGAIRWAIEPLLRGQ